jgi:RNA polymerase-binding transcription factor DksA
MSLDPTILAELKDKLLAEKKRLEDALSKFATKTDVPGEYETRIEEIGTDMEDNVTEVESYVDNLAVEANLEHELRDVLDALEKMDAGTYGICEKTGVEIALDRLRAYPAAKTAISK